MIIVLAPLIIAIVGILGIGFALVFLWAGMKERGIRQQIAEAGINAEAKIVAKKSGGSLYVTYEFEGVGTDGKAQSYRHEQEVKRGTYFKLVEGTVVPIRYLPTDPEQSAQLIGVYADSSGVVWPLIYGVGTLIGAVAIVAVALGSGSQTAQKVQDVSARATTLATASSDLAVIRAALEPLMVEWKTNSDQAIHHITAAEAGLSGVTQEDIVYGYCADGTFYVYAPKGFQPGLNAGTRSSDAYSYNSNADVYCWPKGWLMSKQGDLGNGWFFSNVAIFEATATPSSE
ncbi:MAG: DUF3592 domain-containing protein [Chloroflexota bacterium]